MVINPSPYSLFPFEDHYLEHLNGMTEVEVEEAPDVEHGRKVSRMLVNKFGFSIDVGLDYMTPKQCFKPGTVVKLPALKGFTMASNRS